MTLSPKAGEAPAEPSPVDTFVLSLPDEPASGKDWYLWAGVLALLVLVAFLPAATGQFIWDDDHHVGVIDTLDSVQGLAKIWMPLDNATPQYYPLTSTTFWIEHHFWGDNPLGYHLVNILLQAASAIVVWRLLRRLAVPGAWLAAAIWAVHPLQAETVCWISERKNLLSGLLFFSSIWFYLEFAGLTPAAAKAGTPGPSSGGSTVVLGNRVLAYAVSWLLFALALLAKTVACAMPAVMIVVLWWKRRKLGFKSLWPLAPFFIAGLAMSGITVYRETAQGGTVEARGADWGLTLLQRFLIAGRGFWFYIFKLIWPTNLTFSYPRVWPSVEALGMADYELQWLYLLAAVALFAMLWLGRRQLGRAPLAAALYYGLTLFPALGFINVFPMKYSFVADHFQYLSGLALIVLAVSAANKFLTIRRVGVVAAVGAVLVLSLSFASWSQARIYESPLTLWQDTLAKNPSSWMAADNLGIELIKRGEQHQRDAANDQAEGLTDVAASDQDQAQADFQQAETLFKRVLQIRPANYATHNALGLLYRQTGRWAQAESELRTAVDMDERDDPAHQLTAPYVNYAQVLEHNHPDADPRKWLDLAIKLSDQPRIKLKPTDMAMVHLAYGDFWFRHARLDQADQERADLNHAISELIAGLNVAPTDIPSLFDLARAYQRIGQIDQEKADQAQAAGRLNDAAAFEDRSLHVDDAQAQQICQAILATVPNRRHAGALEEMGELYFHDILDAPTQHEAVQNMLRSIDSFKSAASIDPNIPGAAQYLAAINRKLIDEGKADQTHESTWFPLRQKVEALLKGAPTKDAALDVDRALHDAAWPLPQIHPMRAPLEDLHNAIGAFVIPGSSPQAVANLHAAARNVLQALSNRDASRDAVNDAVAAALCFEGALAADEHSASAWRDLKSTTTTLASAVTARGDVPGGKDALDRANLILGGYASATQPSATPR